MDRIGKYEVLDQIGSGGFATVYKGYDPFIKRSVAIKICYSRDAETQQRFFREAEIAGKLVHRNIISVYDFGVHEGNPYLVEEFLSGEDLAHLIRRGHPGDLGTKLDYLAQIARGLEYAHAEGVIHRDIKPGNVRVLETGQVKIMDFGTAKLADVESHLTQAGMTLGTVAYLSPERLLGKKAGLNSDIFSLGVLAYELLSFRRPFSARSIPNLIDQVLNASPVPLRNAWPDCPQKLEAIVRRSLRKDPAERYQTCSEVLADLDAVAQEVLGHGLVGANPEPTTAIVQPPTNVQVSGLLERARQLHARGKIARAAVMLEEVLELVPDNTEAQQLMAACQAAASGQAPATILDEDPSTSAKIAHEGPEERKARKRGEAVASVERYIEGGQLVAAMEALKFGNQLFGPIEDAPRLCRRAIGQAREELAATKGAALEASRAVVDAMIRLRQAGALDLPLARRLAGWVGDLDPDDFAARDLLAMVEKESPTAARPATYPGVGTGTSPGTSAGTHPGTSAGTHPGTSAGTHPGTRPGSLLGTAGVGAALSVADDDAADPVEEMRKRREAVTSIEDLLAKGDARTAEKALQFAVNLYGELEEAPTLRQRIEQALQAEQV